MNKNIFLLLILSLFLSCKPKEENNLITAIKGHALAVHVKDGWIRDPYIMLAPDGFYYLTGTTTMPDDLGEQTDKYNIGMTFVSEKLGLQPSVVGYKIRVWRSPDLVNWEYVGEPFSLEQGYWAEVDPEAFQDKDNKEWLVWAPEMFYADDKWIFVHTSPEPVAGGANLIIKDGNNMMGDEISLPMGIDMRYKHDPSLFLDNDGIWYLIWENTFIAPLLPGFKGLASEPKRIDPSNRIIGHEGATIRKIGNKYVLFGTAWSTDQSRKGSYNLYYCTTDAVEGPYGVRRFVGRFLGHGTPFQDKEGNWWCTAFFNVNVPPLESEGIEQRDLKENAQTINEQGVTIVPLEVQIQKDGDIYIRAKDKRYANPGPDENQQFEN